MKKIKIITDSAINMDEKVLEALEIEVVPLNVMIDGVIYSDDELEGEAFMEKMAAAQNLPKTSQPSIGLFSEMYEKFPSDEYEIISIHLSKILSGTVDAARVAAQMSGNHITIVDSGFIDQALAFQVEKAGEMAKNGATKEEILASLQAIKDTTRLFIGISSVENLVKGGRIGKAKGMITNLLNIKLILELSADPEIGMQVISKGRGNKTFTKWLEELKGTLQTKKIQKIAISHAAAPELATLVKNELQEIFPDLTIPVRHTGSVIATHAGSGAFAVEYYE